MNCRNYLPFLTILFLATSLHSGAQSDVDQSRRNAIVKAIEQVAPSVVSVNVVTIKAERVIEPFFDDFWGFFDFYRPRQRLRGRQVESMGSGFIFDKEGHIITNYHVVEDAHYVSVTLADGRKIDVDLVGVDRRGDLAVLQAKESGLPYVTKGDSENLMTGEWAIAIGNPFGTLMRDHQPTVSVGVVSANHRRISRDIGGGDRLYQDMIQTDAAINPGNSGGPLVNAKGEVIGVNTMIFSKSGGSVGLGFALPINRVERIAEEIIQYGRRRDPWPGFRAESVESYREVFLQQHGISAREGCLVIEILESSPAYDAGLQLGDVIISVDGEEVIHPSEIDFAVWDKFVGEYITLDIDRQGHKESIRFRLIDLGRQT